MFLVNSHPVFMSLKATLILKPSSFLHNQGPNTIFVVTSIAFIFITNSCTFVKNSFKCDLCSVFNECA